MLKIGDYVTRKKYNNYIFWYSHRVRDYGKISLKQLIYSNFCIIIKLAND